MQTIKSILEQFDVTINLSEKILNKEVNGDFKEYSKRYNEKNELELIFEGKGLFPNTDPEFMSLVPKDLRFLLRQGNHEENCRLVIIPENEWEHLRIETWEEGDWTHVVIYNNKNEEIGRS